MCNKFKSLEDGYLDVEIIYTVYQENRWGIFASLVPEFHFPEENFGASLQARV